MESIACVQVYIILTVNVCLFNKKMNWPYWIVQYNLTWMFTLLNFFSLLWFSIITKEVSIWCANKNKENIVLNVIYVYLTSVKLNV